MSVSNRDLIANLLAIRTTVDNTLRLLNGIEEKPQASKDPAQCGHPNKVAAMGGHYFCPDCKSEWREESADE
jgi:predicted Zn-ribbon and HTH transcriptional regulator